MAWWNLFFSRKDNEFEDIKEDMPEEMGSLNVKTAIEAHMKWKQRLQDVISGTSTEKLNLQVVSSDNQCPLGKWLYGEGMSQFGSEPEFKQVVKSHAHFHQCAGHTLKLALDGKVEQAERELRSGNFAKASRDVTSHLLHLLHDVQGKK